MKFVLALIFFTSPTFAFEHPIDLLQSDDLAKFSVIIESDRDSKLPNVHCTGTIISNTQILTLSYCFKGIPANNYWIYFGIDAKNPIDIRRIKNVTHHPRAGFRNVPYDIAVVELDHPIPMGFQSVKITTTSDSKLITKLPFSIFLIGAGATTPAPYVDLNRLTYVKQKGLIENFYPLYRLRDAYVFCLDQETYGSDAGDLGGPVVFQENNQYQLIGLVSGSIGSTSPFQVPGTCEYQQNTSVQQINVTADWIISQLIP